jgi:hypothetical protein
LKPNTQIVASQLYHKVFRSAKHEMILYSSRKHHQATATKRRDRALSDAILTGSSHAHLIGKFLSAEAGTALNPFRSLPYIGMYGKVSRSFSLSFPFYIDHGVAATYQFVEIRRHRGSRGTWPGCARLARRQTRRTTPIDVLLLSN